VLAQNTNNDEFFLDELARLFARAALEQLLKASEASAPIQIAEPVEGTGPVTSGNRPGAFQRGEDYPFQAERQVTQART
jgi:hypothetical protein